MVENGFLGTASATSNGSDYNANTFLVWSILARVRTMQPCKVLAVTNDGGVAPVGFVTLQPLVNQLDGYGNATPHGQLHNVPYFRLQGGASAIILDPQVGDIGFAGFADRDISSVKANKGQANPGSKRQFSMADAVYMGGILNGTPTQFVQFNADGITIHSPNDVVINAGGNITATAQGNASVSAQGTATVSGTAGVNINSPASVEISGSAGVSITTNGNATATINGSMTATATGPVSLSAPTISLN